MVERDVQKSNSVQGHARAQYNLAAMHHEGQGGPVSLEHAIFWVKRAVAQGHNKAMQTVQDLKSTCFSCGKPCSASGENMKSCSGCKCAIYCSEVCQRAHWKNKDGGHKTMCKKIQALHLKMAGGASGSSGSAAAGGAGESKTNGGDGGAASVGGPVAVDQEEEEE